MRARCEHSSKQENPFPKRGVCMPTGQEHTSNTSGESIMGTSSCYALLTGCLLENSQDAITTPRMNCSGHTAARANASGLCVTYPEEDDAPDCLVLLQIASFGKQGAELGTDESSVAMITAKIFDIHTRSTTGTEWQIYVREPSTDPYSGTTYKSEDAMRATYREEAWISEECRTFTGLTFADLRDAPSLLEGLESLDTWLQSQGLCHLCKKVKSSAFSRKCHFEVAVDGGTGLRLVLHQSLTQPLVETYARFPYLCRFIDLKKVFMSLYPRIQSSLTLPEMMQDLNLMTPEFPPGFTPEPAIWTNLAVNSLLNDASEMDYERRLKCQQVGFWPRLYCRSMAKLCAKMTADGANWKMHENIQISYQPKFMKSTEAVAEDVVARARGLPWQATDMEIHHFFRGLNIEPGGIALVLSKAGRRNGEAVLRFTDREQRDLALKKHKHHMDQRYIEIYSASSAEFVAVAGGETQEAEKYLSKFTKPSQSLLRMRGLPYTVAAEEIIDFFAKTDCQVQFDREGILFVNRKDGRSTGDAFVMFATDVEAERALKNHRQHIGNRYIELFRSTPAEVNQVMNTVKKHATDLMAQIWSLSYEQDGGFPQSGTFLEIPNLPAFQNITKGLLIPSPTYTLPLLNLSPVALTTPNTLSDLLPGVPNPGPGMSNYLIRMRGMPPGTTVNDILNFLGVYWQAVALHGIHLIYTARGEPSGEAFVRFTSEQAVQMVIANKQGHRIINAATGAQTNVHLSQATSFEMVDFISIPDSQPTFNWNNAVAFGAHLNPCALIPGAAALPTPLVMQMRATEPFATQSAFTTNLKADLTIASPQTIPTIKLDTDILSQARIRAGFST